MPLSAAEAALQAHTNCELLTAQAGDVHGLLRIFKADAAALSRFALQSHASRLALLGINTPRRPKTTAFAGIPENSTSLDPHRAKRGGRHTASGGSGSTGGAGSRSLGGDIRQSGSTPQAIEPPHVSEAAGGRRPPLPQAWSHHGSVASIVGPAHGSVVSLRGIGGVERGSRMGDAAGLEEGMAALMERMDEVGRVQEQLCQTLVALSLESA